MSERFIENRNNQMLKQKRFAVIISNTFLFVGAIVIVSSLIFLLFNLDKSDSLVIRLIPFFVGGLGFIICSQMVKSPETKLHR